VSWLLLLFLCFEIGGTLIHMCVCFALEFALTRIILAAVRVFNFVSLRLLYIY